MKVSVLRSFIFEIAVNNEWSANDELWAVSITRSNEFVLTHESRDPINYLLQKFEPTREPVLIGV